MIDLASLAIRVDATEADAGAGKLDKLTSAGDRAEKEMGDLGRASAAAGKQIQTASQQAAAMAASAQRSAAAATGMGNSSKLASHQVQNLAFQMNDLVVGLASGQKPMTVFMQQGAQIGQIMAQAGVGVRGFVGEIAGMASRVASAHPYLAVLAAAAAATAATLKLFTAELNAERRGELDAYANSLGLTKKEMEELGPITVGLGDLLTGLGRTFQKELGVNVPGILEDLKRKFFSAFDSFLTISRMTTSAIYAAFAGTFNGVKATWSSLPEVLGEAAVGAANLVIKALNYLLEKGAQYVNTWSATINAVMSAIPGFENAKIGSVSAPKIPEITNQFSGAGKAAAGAFMDAYGKAFAEAEGAQKRIGQEIIRNTLESAKEGYRAAAESKGFLDPETAKKAGGRAGKAAGEEFGKNFMTELARSLILYGQDLEKTLAASLKASGDAEWKLFTDRLSNDANQGAQAIKEAAEANALWNSELAKTINYLGQIGGAGGAIGSALAIFQGVSQRKYDMLPGKAGAFVGLLSQNEGGRKLLDGFGEVLNKAFGGQGVFAKTMSSLFQGAGMGTLVGSAVFGGSKGGQIGSALGGAVGQAFAAGSKMLGKALGSAAGPLGAIAGSLIGGLLGGLFKKDKYGSAAISNSGVGISGNNADGKSGASSAGNSVSGAISRIAEQLGGTVGNYAVSIGLTNGKWNVNPGTVTGMIGTTKQRDTIDFKQDQEGAIRWAIANAIQDGAIQGVNHIQQWLLQNTKDIDAALAQATRVGAVFDELKQKTDPLGYALEQIDKQFGDLRDTFTQAGATAEEMAKLEQLIAMKRQDAILEELNKRRELEVRLMEAQGNAAGALALSREIELSQTDANLQSLMRQIYAAEDARTASEQASAAIAEAASKFGDLAKNLRDYASSLTGSDSAGALGYRSAQVEFLKQSSLAAAGDLGGLGSLQNAASSFLDVSRSRSTAAQYQRDFGQVLAALDKAATVAEGLSAPGAAVLTGSGAGTLENVAVTITDGNASLKAEIVQLRSDLNAALLAIAQNTSSADRTLKRWDRGDSMAVTADDALPVDTTP